MKPLFPMALLGACMFAQPAETAYDIMGRVGDNQERAQTMRSAFVYHQQVLTRFKRNNGKLAREEIRDYTVTPTADGVKKELTHFEGRYAKSGKLITYDKPGFEYKSLDIDGDLAKDLTEDLTNDSKSRDGIGGDLFPLTCERQRKYNFKLEGGEDYRGTEVWRISFTPRKPSLLDCDEEDSGCWSGEVLVDKREYQPVLITTWLAKNLPLAVRTLLGTDLKHVGFKVTYKKFDEGLWFPVSYGGEFHVRGVFFYKRHIAIALTNSGFRRAEVNSRISFNPVP